MNLHIIGRWMSKAERSVGAGLPSIYAGQRAALPAQEAWV